MSATVTTKIPLPDFPFLLREEVCGIIFSPTWMETLKSNPLRDEKKIAGTPFELITAPDTGDQAKPVGLGAFKFESYTPGNGNAFVAVRNDDYWRGESGTGEGLPYLDKVELVVAVDIESRSSGLRSGQFDIIHTANADEVASFREGGDEVVMLDANENGETGHGLINVGAGTNKAFADLYGLPAAAPMDPESTNVDSPMLIESCPVALAQALDCDRWVEERGAGIVPAANGPFSPGQIGYLDDSGYPDYDVDAAKATMETCLSEYGKDTIEFTYNTTNDPFNVESNQLVVSMWEDAFGDAVNATITRSNKASTSGSRWSAISTCRVGAPRWLRPIEQFYWWSSASSSPIKTLALNFGRFQDPEIDAKLIEAISNPDAAKRKAAAEDVNREFGKHVYNFWIEWTLWGVVANPSVRNISTHEIPDGQGLALPVIAGKHYVSQIWCEGGQCGE